MKINKFYLDQFIVVILFSILLLGCDANEGPGNPGPEPVKERTKITMASPGDDNVDWSNVKIAWSEEFNNSGGVNNIWNFEARNTTNPDIADQLQVYSEDNVSISDGKLKITAKKESGIYSAARVNGKYAFKYGRIEVSAKLPEQEKSGIWAKLALIGDNVDAVGWPRSGEIDFMEYFSYKPNKTYINVHSGENNVMNGTLISASHSLETVEEHFHAYGILWTDKYLKFYVDDPTNIIYTLNQPASPNQENWPFNEHFYLLIDLVIGGKYAGAEGVDDSLFPATLEIDYIRLYHLQ